MNGKLIRDRLLASTIIAGTVALSAPAFAQITTSAPSVAPAAGQAATVSADASAPSGGEIVVTGSRIPHPDLESGSPVTVVGAKDFKLTGTTRTEDLLNSLPQVFAGQGGSISNGATGIATVDLRNLGPQRTLVLVDGRRVVPGDPRTPFTDLNFIPSALIKRVDVLTGGASSVYGADAVAGVVNFVMDTNFSGFKLDGQYSFYNHDNRAGSDVTNALDARGFGYPNGVSNDGGTIDVTATIGAGFDDNRGHVVAYAGYRKINPVTQADRDYSACSLAATKRSLVASGSNPYTCGGSGTSANGTFITNVGTYQVGGAGGHDFIPGSTPYNFAPANYYQRPDERYTAGFFAHYDVSDAFKPYMEFMFMDDRTVAQIGASGDFGNTSYINCDNPLLSAQQSSVICAPGNLATNPNTGTTTFLDANGNPYSRAVVYPLRRNVEGGPRRDDLQHTSYRGVIGAKGDLAKGISYDASYQYGRTDFAETYFNDFSIKKLQNALNVIDVNGTPTCRSVVDGSDPACVPYDIFGGGVSAAALNYLQTPGFQRGQNTEQVANANITVLGGEYGVQSPWANSGIALNFGAEYRKETLNLTTDQEFTIGDLSGQGGATLGGSGNIKVKELFAEVSIPLVDDKPFFDKLELDAGYRRSHYNTAGSGYTLIGGAISTFSGSDSFDTNTFKVEGKWKPVKDIEFRASFNRAVRAPNVTELFGAQSVALDGATDPCAGAIGSATLTATAAQCALTGVSAAQYGNITANPASQYNGFSGGNPFLKPEVSYSKTVGVVLTPSFLRGFSATVDYWDIKIKNVIATFGADQILVNCLNGDASFCSQVHRDGRGSLYLTPNGYVIDNLTNIGAERTKGIDVAASYTQGIGNLGSLGFQLNGTWLKELKPINSYNCAGYFGVICGQPSPKWRHTARVTWTLPSGPSLSLRWRYLSKVKLDQYNAAVVAPAAVDVANIPPGSSHINAFSYFDLTAQMPVADKFTFTLGVQNLLDKQPPLIGSGQLSAVVGNGNTFPQVYDALGRYIYFGATLDL